MGTKQTRQKKYEEAIKKGLCTKCYKPATVDKFGKILTRCQVCRDRDKKYLLNREYKYRMLKRKKDEKDENEDKLIYDDPVELIEKDPIFER